MKWVVDASVAAKWLLPCSDLELAVRILVTVLITAPKVRTSKKFP